MMRAIAFLLKGNAVQLEGKSFALACLLTVAFPVLLISTVASDVALSVIALLFFVHCVLTRDWGWCEEAWVRALLLLWLVMLARAPFADHPAGAFARALPFVRYIVFTAALARWTLLDETTWRRFFTVLTSMLVFSALDGVAQYILGSDFLLHYRLQDPNTGHYRLTGPFTKPILGIMLVWVTYPALLPHFSGKHRVAALAAFLVIALAILLSGERTALLLLGFGGLIAALLLPVRRTWLLGGVACLLVLGGAVALLSPVIFERQVASSIHTLTHWSESPYGMLLASDLTLAAEHPVIGLGVGQFKEHCEALYPGDAERITAMCNTHPHNIWMEWLIEEGIIGLILFSCFVFAVLAACLRSSALRTNPAFAGWFISFTLRVWPFMATTGFFSRWGAPPFWLALGCLLVYTAGKGQKNAGSPLAVQAPEL